jgi:hypothetical protein
LTEGSIVFTFQHFQTQALTVKAGVAFSTRIPMKLFHMGVLGLMLLGGSEKRNAR